MHTDHSNDSLVASNKRKCIPTKSEIREHKILDSPNECSLMEKYQNMKLINQDKFSRAAQLSQLEGDGTSLKFDNEDQKNSIS